jgi:hypothetical protein
MRYSKIIASLIGVLSLVPLALAPTLLAQKVTPRSPEVHQFISPMVLDLSLEKLFPTPNGISTKDLAFFDCRGVSILGLFFRITAGEKGKAALAYVSIVLQNNSGKDKKVSITFDLRTEASSFGTGSFRGLSVEQGDPNGKYLSFPVTLPAEVAEPYPFLRITVVLVDY